MSVPNKSLDKNKRYAGVKANDFGNKPRANDANRSIVRPQGWANLGKINSRRVPPPANLPSLKSETGAQPVVYDPTIPVNHGWTSNEMQTSITNQSNPTQQQMDSLPMSLSAPSTPAASSVDTEKSRTVPTWSTITAGTNTTEPIPNLLALNDFPRLATAQDRKPPAAESIIPPPNPSFRPSNLATWKEGGGSRIQPLLTDVPSMPQAPSRMYPSSQMWTYQQPYASAPGPMHPQRVTALNDYKSPTILRNKDIDDLSKLTDNTWANASQEINYEEKIRFSDDEDETTRSNPKARRTHPQQMPHTRFIRDDEHLKQMQENKNSELINTLTIAKQRRDEQERHLRNKTYDDPLTAITDDALQIPGYPTRPLLTANEQDNFNASLWQSNRDVPTTSRTRHDTANSQTFSMKSWSDQMDSFNYASLHEKSGGNDESSVPVDYKQSHSESSSPSPVDNNRRLLKSKKVKTRLIQPKQFSQSDVNDYHDKQQSIHPNEHWNNWNDSTENGYPSYSNDQQQRRQPIYAEREATNKSIASNEQANHRNKPLSTKIRPQTNSRSKVNSSASQSLLHLDPATDAKSTTNRNQLSWRPLSPNRPMESPEPTPQETMTYKSQQRAPLNDHKQRYAMINSTILDTASIPPLMSVRSDPTTTGNLYKTSNHTGSAHYSQRHEFYNDTNHDDTGYYESNVQTHQRYPHVNLHNRGYAAVGAYGRYRRGGAHRPQAQQQHYSNYPPTGISSAPSVRHKKNGINRTNTNPRKSTESSQQLKTTVTDQVTTPLIRKEAIAEEVPVVQIMELTISSPTNNINESTQDHIDDKSSIMKNGNKSAVDTVEQRENESNKTNKKTPTTSNAKRRPNKDQQNYYQAQQAPRHRNNYARAMQEYESMPMNQYYGNNRRTTHPSRHTPMHDGSTGYYYEHPQQHYNNQYNYSNDQHYQTFHSKKTSQRGAGSSSTTHRPQKSVVNNGNNNNHTFRHHSTSDNDQKEGEEWETASESSTNMRNGHHDNNGINITETNTTKSIHCGRTPPKKPFSSQRPNTRQIFKYANA